MITELLGPSIMDIFKSSPEGRGLSIKTITLIGIGMVQAVNAVFCFLSKIIIMFL